MTGHARLCGRNAGKGRLLDRRVAVAAVDPDSGYVVLMTEGDWLGFRIADVAHIIKAINVEQDAKEGRDNDNATNNRKVGDPVHTAAEYLSHLHVASGRYTK